MPNRPRLFVPGVSLHLRQRGNNRCAIFGDNSDYELFLVMLEAAMKRHRVDVHGYTLMTTHTHLQVTPSTAVGTSEAMKKLGGDYVQYFNRKYQRVGTLWTGRYKAKAITDERYWLTCLRYIEQNPVRAALVVQPEQYRWSSYRVHALGERSDWLASHPVLDALGANPAEGQAAYRAICATPLTGGEIARQQFKN
jgi:putative transposase